MFFDCYFYLGNGGRGKLEEGRELKISNMWEDKQEIQRHPLLPKGTRTQGFLSTISTNLCPCLFRFAPSKQYCRILISTEYILIIFYKKITCSSGRRPEWPGDLCILLFFLVVCFFPSRYFAFMSTQET